MCGTIRTKHEVNRLVNPPPEQDDKGHPEKRKLDAEIDGACFRELLGHHDSFLQNMIHHGLYEEDDRDTAVCGERDNGEQDKTEPLLLDTARLPDVLDAFNQLPTGAIAINSCGRREYRRNLRIQQWLP